MRAGLLHMSASLHDHSLFLHIQITDSSLEGEVLYVEALHMRPFIVIGSFAAAALLMLKTIVTLYPYMVGYDPSSMTYEALNNKGVFIDGHQTNYTDFLYLAPLLDNIQLFGYSDRIDHSVCTTIESAILAGWKFQLIGPTVAIPNYGGRFSVKINKLFALDILMNALAANVTVVFADTLDALFQRTFDEFKNVLMQTEYQDGNTVFAAENNCWPFNRSNKKTYSCPLMQGKRWIQGHDALGCKLQNTLYQSNRKKSYSNKTNEARSLHNGDQKASLNSDSFYLNSGLSVGLVRNYKQIAAKALFMTLNYPPLCIDDQGLFAWQLVGEYTAPMSLDYNSDLFGTLGGKDYFFDPNIGSIGIWHNDTNNNNNSSSSNNYIDDDNIINNNNNNNNDVININYNNKDNLFSIPFLIHFNGGAKQGFHRTRDQMIEFKKSKFNVLHFLKTKTFWLDGIEKKFIDICGEYFENDWTRRARENSKVEPFVRGPVTCENHKHSKFRRS